MVQNERMGNIRLRTSSIESIIALLLASEVGPNAELDLDECKFCLDTHNIKVVPYQEGFIAYHSIHIGRGGLGPTRLLALVAFLKNYQFNCQDETDFEKQLLLRFN